MREVVLRNTGDTTLDVVGDAGVVDVQPGFVREANRATSGHDPARKPL